MELLEQVVKTIALLLGVISLVFVGIKFSTNMNPKNIVDYFKLLINIITVALGMILVFYSKEIAIIVEPYFHLEMSMYYGFIIIGMIVYIMVFSIVSSTSK